MRNMIKNTFAMLVIIVGFLPLVYCQSGGIWTYPTSAPTITWTNSGNPDKPYTGSELEPFKIKTCQELADLAYMVNNGTDYNGLHFSLEIDLDLAGTDSHQWTPIGMTSTAPFRGFFNGNNHTISNLYFNKNADNFVGLFGVVMGSIQTLTYPRIEKLGLLNVNLTAKNNVGAIVGSLSAGLITGCYSSGKIRGNLNVGGIVGYCNGDVVHCFNVSEVNAASAVGGITGYVSLTQSIISCYNSGSINGTNNVGGIIGYMNSENGNGAPVLNGCYNSGVVTGTNVATTNGVVGSVDLDEGVEIRDCYYDKQICNLTRAVGGVEDNANLKGYLTSEMILGNEINGFSSTDWLFTNGFYPVLRNVFAGSSAQAVTQQAILLDKTENRGLVKNSSFVANVSSDCVWTSDKTSSINFVGNVGNVTLGNTEQDVTVTCTKGGISKSIVLKVVADNLLFIKNDTDRGRVEAVVNGHTITEEEGSLGYMVTLGSIVTLKAIPEIGYNYVTWWDGLEDNVSPRSYTFQKTVTISATFELKYTITSSCGNNGQILPVGTDYYTPNTNKMFTITPNNGYVVDVLTVDGTVVDGFDGTSYSFNDIAANHTIDVTFKKQQYTITALAEVGGAITPSGTVDVEHGGSQLFTIQVDNGHVVDAVHVDGTIYGADILSNNTYTFNNVVENHTINVTFKLKQYRIIASASTGGTITPTGTIWVDHGGEQTFTITPNGGYMIDAVTVDLDDYTVADLVDGDKWIFSDVTAAHSIYASFISESNTFVGNGDWLTPGNWSEGSVPSANHNVVIQGNAIISNTGVKCQNIDITTGSITINASGDLAANSITNSNPAKLVINSSANNFGALSIAIGTAPQATVNLYLKNTWHFINVPITNSFSANAFFKGWFVDNYNESDASWKRLVDGSSVNNMQGYSVGNFNDTDKTITFTGGIYIAPSLQYSNLSYTPGLGGGNDNYGTGWNLIGNKWLQPIDLKANDYTFDNIERCFYVWDDAQSKYLTYPNKGGSYGTLANGIMPPLQGFMVRTTGARNSLQVNKATGYVTTGGVYKSDNEVNDGLAVRIIVSGTTYSDDVTVVENSICNDGYDDGYDARKMYGGVNAPQIYTYGINDNEMLAINQKANIAESILTVEKGNESLYTINGKILSIPENLKVSVVLTDLTLKKSIVLAENQDYEFNFANGEKSRKFKVEVLKSPLEVDDVESSIKIFAFERVVNVISAEKALIEIIDVSGRIIKSVISSDVTTRITDLNSGVYIVRVTNNRDMLSSKVIVR